MEVRAVETPPCVTLPLILSSKVFLGTENCVAAAVIVKRPDLTASIAETMSLSAQVFRRPLELPVPVLS